MSDNFRKIKLAQDISWVMWVFFRKSNIERIKNCGFLNNFDFFLYSELISTQITQFNFSGPKSKWPATSGCAPVS